MSWNKSFVIPAGTAETAFEDIVACEPVDRQPNEGYSASEHQSQVNAAKETAVILLKTLGARDGKDIAVSLGGHTPCGEKDWGGSISVNACHVTPQKPKEG